MQAALTDATSYAWAKMCDAWAYINGSRTEPLTEVTPRAAAVMVAEVVEQVSDVERRMAQWTKEVGVKRRSTPATPGNCNAWNTLGADVILIIIRHAHTQSICMMAQTCKDWRDATKEWLVGRKLSLFGYEGQSRSEWIQALTAADWERHMWEFDEEAREAHWERVRKQLARPTRELVLEAFKGTRFEAAAKIAARGAGTSAWEDTDPPPNDSGE